MLYGERGRVKKIPKSFSSHTHISSTVQHEDKDFLKGEKIRVKKAKNVDEILEPYWSYVDYDLLEYIIKELGTSELQEEMRKYIPILNSLRRQPLFTILIWQLKRK